MAGFSLANNASNYSDILNAGSTGSSTSKSSGTVWDSLFGNLGGILMGTSGLVTAFKSDPNEIARAQASQQQIIIPGLGTPVSSNTLWIIAIVGFLILIAIVFMVMNKKGK